MNATIMQRAFFALLAASASGAGSIAADIEITETLQLPECPSPGWVRANAGCEKLDSLTPRLRATSTAPQKQFPAIYLKAQRRCVLM
jgi:hypothetical protein